MTYLPNTITSIKQISKQLKLGRGTYWLLLGRGMFLFFNIFIIQYFDQIIMKLVHIKR